MVRVKIEHSGQDKQTGNGDGGQSHKSFAGNFPVSCKDRSEDEEGRIVQCLGVQKHRDRALVQTEKGLCAGIRQTTRKASFSEKGFVANLRG